MPEQEFMYDLLKDDSYIDLLASTKAKTVIVEGRVLVCAGVMPITDYMGKAWLLMSKHAGRDLLKLTREVGDFLNKTNYARIETPVMRSYKNGHRWCKILGFVNETPEIGMRNYGFEGETYDLYAMYPKE